MGEKLKTIDEYIAAQEASIQHVLQSLRETILEAAPECEERLAWQMPSFWQGEYLIHFAVMKNYLGIFPGKDYLIEFEERLSSFSTTKAMIRMNYDAVDHGLVREILAWRLGLIKDSGEKKRTPARAMYAMPEEMKEALKREGLEEAYALRPPYQRNDYIAWVVEAKREETKKSRLEQMLQELRDQDKFKNQPYKMSKK